MQHNKAMLHMACTNNGMMQLCSQQAGPCCVPTILGTPPQRARVQQRSRTRMAVLPLEGESQYKLEGHMPLQTRSCLTHTHTRADTRARSL